MRTNRLAAALTAFALVSSGAAHAKLDLVTIPARDDIRIVVDVRNTALVQETRAVTLDAGKNRVEFAWPNVNVALDTVQFEPVSESDGFAILSTAIPPNSPNVLVLDTLSDTATELALRATYVPEGITWIARHIVAVNADETALTFDTSLLVTNDTGEDYANALVETPMGDPFRLTIRSREKKEIPVAHFENVPIEKFYEVADPYSKPNVVATRYRLKFDKAPLLLPGRVRIFQSDANGSVALIGEELLKYVPAGDEVILHPGTSQDIEVEGKVTSRARTDEKRNRQGVVVLYNTAEESEIVVRNRKAVASTVVLSVRTEEDWDLLSHSEPFERKDATSFEFRVTVEPRKEKTVMFKLRGNNRMGGFALSE